MLTSQAAGYSCNEKYHNDKIESTHLARRTLETKTQTRLDLHYVHIYSNRKYSMMVISTINLISFRYCFVWEYFRRFVGTCIYQKDTRGKKLPYFKVLLYSLNTHQEICSSNKQETYKINGVVRILIKEIRKNKKFRKIWDEALIN